ncbi:MAG: Rrf2 family transcriptional regulator [Planctomycetaceae bacterium]|nr:Rrf2 family transcriptional regulator [Planctomycetaceae bacterium]
MEIIPRHTDYAIRALLCLAQQPQTVVPCGQVARQYGIPESFAYKILRKLVVQGLAESRPGRPGGFRLAKPAADISLRQIMEVFQGPIAVSPCVLDHDFCQRSAACPVCVKWRQLTSQISQFLTDVTLQELLEQQTLCDPKAARNKTRN